MTEEQLRQKLLDIAAARAEMVETPSEQDWDHVQLINSLMDARGKIPVQHPQPKFDIEKWIPLIGHLTGIWSVIGYERASVIGTKALSLIGKVKF